MCSVLVGYELVDKISSLCCQHLRKRPFAFVCLFMGYFSLFCIRAPSYAFDCIRVLSFGLVSAWCMGNALLIVN